MSTEYTTLRYAGISYEPAGAEIYDGEHTTLDEHALLFTSGDGVGLVVEGVGLPAEAASWLRDQADRISAGRDCSANEYADTALADLVDGNEAIEDEREARAMFSAGSAITMGLLAVADELRTINGRNQPEQEEARPGADPAAPDFAEQITELAEQLWAADPQNRTAARTFAEDMGNNQDRYVTMAQRVLNPAEDGTR